MLHAAVSKRINIHNLSSEVLELYSLAGQLFDKVIGTNEALISAMSSFHEAFVEWVETPTRCIYQITPNWTLGVETIEDDEFVTQYIIRPCRMMPSSIDALITAYGLGLPTSRSFNFFDLVEALSGIRQYKYRLSDFASISTAALVTQSVTASSYMDDLRLDAPTLTNFTWADSTALFCIAKFTGSTTLQIECPSIFSHAHVDGTILSFVTNLGNTPMPAAKIPKSTCTLSISDRATALYNIGNLSESAFKMSSRMYITLGRDHGLVANDYVILRIDGKFTVTKCGIRQLVNYTGYREGRNIGFWNMAFGELVPTANTLECTTVLANTLNRAYAEIYKRFIQPYNPNGHISFPLSGTIYEPSKLADVVSESSGRDWTDVRSQGHRCR